MNFCVSVRWEPSNVSFYTLKKNKKRCLLIVTFSLLMVEFECLKEVVKLRGFFFNNFYFLEYKIGLFD